MAAELPRPGVEVIQVFRTVTPTVVTPTLVPCVVGACKQVVDTVVQSPAGGQQINQGSLVQLPAFFLATRAPGTPPTYALPAGVLVFSVDRHPPVTVTFTAGNYKPIDVVTVVNKALVAAGETDGFADILGSHEFATGTAWRLRTLSIGDSSDLQMDPSGQSAAILTGTADLSAIAYNPGPLDGTTLILQINGSPVNTTITFSNPVLNQGMVLTDANGVLGVVATASFNVGNQLVITTAKIGADAQIKVIGGTALATLGLVLNQTANGKGSTPGILSAFGISTVDHFFGESTYSGWELKIPTTNFPDPRKNLEELSFETDTIRAFVGTSGGAAVLEALRTTTLLRHLSGAPGLVTAIDDGNGDNVTPYVAVTGEDFTSLVTLPTQGVMTAAAAPNFGLLSGKSVFISDGKHPREVQFGVVANITDVVNTINAVFDPNDGIVASSFGGFLRLTCTKKREDGLTTALGEDSEVVIYGGSAVTPANYLDTAVVPTLKIGRVAGLPQKAVVGDELWVDGVFLGKITQVAPNGFNNRLKIDKTVQLTFSGKSYYIIAKALAPLPGDVTRPQPDLVVDGSGNLRLKLGLLRDTAGKISESVTTTALLPSKGGAYVAYRALRLDTTAKAKVPGLLRFNDTVQVTDVLSPVSTENPLALGLFFALLNAPAVQCTGIGVSAISADSPYGTVEAFTEAAEYLESFEVYAIAPMTHDAVVGQVFKTHVDVMSAPANKGERITLMNPSAPTHKLDTLVASGTNGNTVGNAGLTFDTGVGNLAALLLGQGIDPTSTIPVSAGLFLDIAANDKHYSITSVSGSVVTILITFAPGENDDGFYSTTDLNDPPLPSALISEPFALRIRGASLTQIDGTPDKDGMADTYAALAQSISDRRYWQTMPDKARAVIGGLEQLVEGFYMNAAIAGMIGQQPPQQSFTNYPMAGFSGLQGSNDYFTDRQMNRMAAGGNYIIVQDVPGGPLISRMALTTDMTSIETRTDSITKVVDFTAKFLRRGLKNFIGRFNITQGFLDSLGHVLEGLLDFLKGAGVLIGARVNNIIQDEAAPDTVLIDITLDVPYPCNYIRLTLVI